MIVLSSLELRLNIEALKIFKKDLEKKKKNFHKLAAVGVPF